MKCAPTIEDAPVSSMRVTKDAIAGFVRMSVEVSWSTFIDGGIKALFFFRIGPLNPKYNLNEFKLFRKISKTKSCMNSTLSSCYIQGTLLCSAINSKSFVTNASISMLGLEICTTASSIHCKVSKATRFNGYQIAKPSLLGIPLIYILSHQIRKTESANVPSLISRLQNSSRRS